MLDARVETAVVVGAGGVRGVVTAQDVARSLAAGCDAARTPVQRICDRHPVTARPQETLADLHGRLAVDGPVVVVAIDSDREPVGVLIDEP